MITIDTNKLATGWVGQNWIKLKEVNSTNEYLKQHGVSLPDGTVVTAQCQTEGRGRGGSHWNSDHNGALYLSVLLKNCPKIRSLPLVMGLAAARAVEKLSGIDCQIKWPNDIILQNKKLAGILCESRIMGASQYAVCGIGVNVLQPQSYFDACHLPYGISIFAASGLDCSVLTVGTKILEELEPLIELYRTQGFVALKQDYRLHSATVGKQIRLITADGEELGEAVDLTEEGELICKISGKLKVVTAGEVSIRGLYGYV